MSHVSSGNHYRSDPVQVQSTGNGVQWYGGGGTTHLQRAFVQHICDHISQQCGVPGRHNC